MPQWLTGIPLKAWETLAAMSPYLLFGFLVAGLLSVFVSPALIGRHLGGSGVLRQSLKAALLGVPLPLCSCGVMPVAASLRARGANRSATVSFLISTPQTGVDSILVTLGLLGPVFAVARPLIAFVSGVIGGVGVGLLAPEDAAGAQRAEQPAIDCDTCTTGDAHESRLHEALEHGFVALHRDIGKPLLAGIAVAGVIAAIVPPNFFAGVLGRGIVPMLVMMALGIPVYVCATASVPVAAALIGAGVSPGAALVFLMTGPATNAATVSTIWKVLGRKTAVLYLCTVALSALAAGMLLDALIPADAVSTLTAGYHMPHSLAHIETGAAVALLALLANALLRRRPAVEAPAAAAIHIAGMHCQHCADAVQQALVAAPGVQGVSVSLAAGTALVAGAGLDRSVLAAKIEELGYTVTRYEEGQEQRKEVEKYH